MRIECRVHFSVATFVGVDTMSSMNAGLPTTDEMYSAVANSDSRYDGVFFVAVKSTGIFCRPGCTARTPLRKNVRFFAKTADALASGFRPCKRCHPLEITGRMPDWLSPVMDFLDQGDRLNDRDLQRLGIEPKRARRWFQKNHGITFQSFARSRRLSAALAQLSLGDEPLQVAMDAGYESLSGFHEAFRKWCGWTPGKIKHQSEPVLLVNRYLSPLGPMLVVADESAVYLLEFADRRALETQCKRLVRRTKRVICPGENGLMNSLAMELDLYFAGRITQFSNPIRLLGTDFQMAVWKQLMEIPYGATTTYESIATKIGRPKASRAVGRANGDNCLAVLVPCHRVIRNDGTLSGYGGGVRRKEWMLQLEGAWNGS